MVPKEEINELKSASELRTAASGASDRLILEAIARACNFAANTGELTTTWTGTLPEHLQKAVEAKGYTVTNVKIGNRPVDTVWNFSWK